MLGNRLNQIRKEKGFTAKRMAELLHTSTRNYRKYESSNIRPSLEGLVQIADILDVSTDYLLCRDAFLERQEKEKAE